MVSRTIAPWTGNNEKGVGQAYITFTITNSYDLDRVAEGLLDEDDVRSVELSGVLMDTGATLLCLPASLVARLGLSHARTVPIRTAAGERRVRMLRNALVRFEDREAQVEVLELPDGTPPLLGAIPMETLGIEPDLTTRQPRKLPLGGRNGYITVF